MRIEGGCLCGAVRYAAEADPSSATVCHCRDCQKFTGSAFATLVAVPKEALTLNGTLKTFSGLGGSGKPILRLFCPECGSSIAEEPGTRPGMVILNIGTFDNPALAKPGREIFRDDALPWIEVHGDIPRFAKRAG
ncbi:MAG TPA: GFA family protein [Stellaceae bacterium]|nr:GFA family protein [Stellaceae bacterium]